MYVLGKRAFERTQRHAGGGLAGGVDEVGDAFGLGKVEFVVEEGAFGKFARLSHARTQFEAAREQHVHHDRAAVSLQFNHVFAGKAGGGGEVEQDAVVYRLPVTAEKVGVKRGARFGRFTAAEGSRQRQQVFAGKTDHADAAASGGGGDGGDGGLGCGHENSRIDKFNGRIIAKGRLKLWVLGFQTTFFSRLEMWRTT